MSLEQAMQSAGQAETQQIKRDGHMIFNMHTLLAGTEDLDGGGRSSGGRALSC